MRESGACETSKNVCRTTHQRVTLGSYYVFKVTVAGYVMDQKLFNFLNKLKKKDKQGHITGTKGMKEY